MGDSNSNGEVIGCKSAFEGLKPVAGMALVQVLLVGINIFYKLVLNDGMDVKILVAYRYMFAAAFICPIALLLERYVCVHAYLVPQISLVALPSIISEKNL